MSSVHLRKFSLMADARKICHEIMADDADSRFMLSSLVFKSSPHIIACTIFT